MPETPPATKSRADLLKRLDPYWKMEAANMVAIPLFILLMSGGRIGWVTLVPMAAMVLLLGVGAVYWWMKVRQLRGERFDAAPVLRRIAMLQWPGLVLTVLGLLVAALGWIEPSLTIGRADRIAATASAALAALEYINYYHRQLQHFDNWTDFRRMLAGKGFRRSWLARDLADLRKKP